MVDEMTVLGALLALGRGLLLGGFESKQQPQTIPWVPYVAGTAVHRGIPFSIGNTSDIALLDSGTNHILFKENLINFINREYHDIEP